MATLDRLIKIVSIMHKGTAGLSSVERNMMKIIAKHEDAIAELKQNDHIHEYVPHTRRTIMMGGTSNVRETYHCKFCTARKIIEES